MQKYLTGHPKGAAAAWMMNGVLQCMIDGVVPGNRNADNIDARLQAYEYLVYPNQTLKGLQVCANHIFLWRVRDLCGSPVLTPA